MKYRLPVIPASLFIALLFTACGGDAATVGEIPIPAVDPRTEAIIPVSRLSEGWWETLHNQKIGTSVKKDQKIVFIGDSITQYWEWESGGLAQYSDLNIHYSFKITNLGFGGDRTQHVIWRLENGEFPAGINPEYVVLMIGTNNSGANNIGTETAAGIGEIVKIIHKNSPKTKILLFSLLPRGAGNNTLATLLNNQTNDIIKKYHGFLNIRYVDIAGLYLNADGTLKNELFTDALHLNAAGYGIWKNKIMEIIGN